MFKKLLLGLAIAIGIVIISAFGFVACEYIVAEESELTMITGTIYPVRGGKGYNYTVTIFTFDGESIYTNIAVLTGIVPSNYAFNYVIENVPTGIYYVHAWIDMDDDSIYTEGVDQKGYYGYRDSEALSDDTTIMPDYSNATVPEIGVAVFDVFLSYVPM